VSTGKKTLNFSREIVLKTMKRLIALKGERVRVKDLLRELHVDQHRLYQLFESWAEIRKLSGLRKNRCPASQVYSDDELLESYQKVVLELGRMPGPKEFAKLSGHDWATLKLRFGDEWAISRRAQSMADYKSVFGKSYKPNKLRHFQLDRVAMNKLWKQARIVMSSHASIPRDDWQKGKHAADARPPFDLLVVCVNDWLDAPVPIVQIEEMFPHGEPRRVQEDEEMRQRSIKLSQARNMAMLLEEDSVFWLERC